MKSKRASTHEATRHRSFRLSTDTDAKLTALAAEFNISKTAVIQAAIALAAKLAQELEIKGKK